MQTQKPDRQEKTLVILSTVRTVLVAAACLALCIAIGVLAPKALTLLNEIDAAMEDLSPTLVKMQQVADNLAIVSQELDDADLPGLVEKTTALVEDGQTTIAGASVALEATLEKVEALNIDALNEAIGDLSAIIAPLARLFGR